MAEGLRRGRSDPLAVKFGRIMSDPAMRERCKALKVGDSTAADVTQGFKVVVTRLEGGEPFTSIRLGGGLSPPSC
jgi:hypothetical protein